MAKQGLQSNFKAQTVNKTHVYFTLGQTKLYLVGKWVEMGISILAQAIEGAVTWARAVVRRIGTLLLFRIGLIKIIVVTTII